MTTIQDNLSYIETELQTLVAHCRTQISEPLYAPMAYAFEGGGKRVRPLLVLMVADMYGKDRADFIKAALALEIYHNFTLLHDDVMDHSEMRRNRPSVPAQFGIAQAILTGDAMLSLAYKLIQEYPLALQPAIMGVFNRMSQDIMVGQQMDMDFETRPDVTLAEYERMIRKKTAVLLSAALEIGAYTADTGMRDRSYLIRAGINAGMAFQLRDDYLDVYGEEATFGKPIGGDIAENKQTWLLIKAQEIARERGEWEQLKAALAIPKEQREEKYRAVRAFYDAYGIPELIRKEIQEQSDWALDLLSRMSNSYPEASQRLVDLIQKMAMRDL